MPVFMAKSLTGRRLGDLAGTDSRALNGPTFDRESRHAYTQPAFAQFTPSR